VLDILLDGPQSRTHFSSSSALKEKRVRRGHPTAVLLDLRGMSMKTSCRMPPRGEVHAGYSLSLKYERKPSLSLNYFSELEDADRKSIRFSFVVCFQLLQNRKERKKK